MEYRDQKVTTVGNAQDEDPSPTVHDSRDPGSVGPARTELAG